MVTKRGKPKLGALIADEIEKDILGAGWPTGAAIATESQLMERHGISRAILREAIGQLERRGIAKMRRGHGGGLTVAAPARTATILALASYLELASSDLGQMLEVRLLLETLSVGLACERITEADIVRLEQQAERLDLEANSLEDVSLANYILRETIAEFSGNPLLMMLIEVIDSSSRDIIAFQVADLRSIRALMVESAANKRKLLAAIVGFDKLTAQQIAAQDAQAQISNLKKYLHRTSAQGHTKRRAGAILQPLKLGHSVALKISHDIRVRGFKEGHHLGFEPELIAKYGISRAAFREAVRMLEAHSIVRMGRGRSGGLTVTAPDPSGTIDSFVLYTTYLGLGSEAMWEVHEALDMGVAQFAARRVTEEDRLRLQEALGAVKEATTVKSKIRKLIGLHQAICETSHNPVLTLLARAVLIAHARISSADGITPEYLLQLTQNYEHIVAAICDRNEGLARRAMFHHIQFSKRLGEPARPAAAPAAVAG